MWANPGGPKRKRWGLGLSIFGGLYRENGKERGNCCHRGFIRFRVSPIYPCFASPFISLCSRLVWNREIRFRDYHDHDVYCFGGFLYRDPCPTSQPQNLKPFVSGHQDQRLGPARNPAEHWSQQPGPNPSLQDLGFRV